MEFLTDAQVAGYGRFVGVPSRSDLERFFVLDSVDRDLLGDRRGDHNRLGLMVQATTVRYIGVFLKDPVDVPWPVVAYVAEQLGIDDPSCVTRYTTREMTAYEHAWEIRKAYEFRVLEDGEVSAEFRRFLDGRAWTHAEGPGALFDHGVGWLRRNLVLLPGISVLLRLVAAVREAAADRMHGLLASAAGAADPMLAGRLRDALGVPPGARLSELESWRRAPTRISGRSLVAAFDRVSQLSGLGVRRVDCSAVPANRMAALARYGLSSKAPTLAALAEPRRTATLLAVTRHLEAVAIDEALDLFAMLMTTRMINPARQVSNSDRLASLPRLERASRMLALVNRELFAALDAAAASGGGVEVAAIWAAIERIASRAKVAGAVATVTELVPEDDGGADIALRVALTERYRTVRPFLSMLGESPALQAAPGGTAVLAAVAALPTLVALRVASKPLLPSDIDPTVVPPMWHRAVYSNPDLPAGAVDRDAYVVCVLEQLFKALRVRDVFASPALRWGDPRAQLLDGPGWEAVRPQILDGLGLNAPVLTHLRGLVTVLDGTWRQTVDRMAEAGDSAKIRVVPAADGRMRLSVDHLDALDIPASLLDLRARTAAMLPRVDLPELLLEVHDWTGFLDAYVHVSGTNARMSDLPISIAALLIADGCNVGLTPVLDPGRAALTMGRLSHADQNYVRADTHAAANVELILAQGKVPIAQAWGGGLLASVDGLRFVVPVRTLNAGPSPKYFGYKRGLTWLNAVNDQVAGIGAQVVSGTPRDSLHILDVLLNLDAGPKPDLVATDEAAYSDMVFGVFRMLGYRFSPRISDIGDTRYWRAEWPADPAADYGSLNAIARNKVNLARIVEHWPDMLRVAGSLVTHQVRAYDVLRMLARDGRPTPLGAAFTEYGRIAKTLHLLAMIDPVDDTHRRSVNTQTTVQESRHGLARKVFHGQRGQIHQAYREGQEDQLGALGIVVNAITLWNTRYLDAAVTQLRDSGYPAQDEDVARLSPLGYAHLNELGRYSFPTLPPGSGLRPLRDPAAIADGHTEEPVPSIAIPVSTGLSLS